MKVTIYSTPTCPYCKMAKEFLDGKNIAYDDVDVAADTARAEEMVEKSGQMGVPVIVVAKDDGKEEVMIGFDKEKLAAAVGAAA
jgi:glutaredoxin-like YruB-family protein